MADWVAVAELKDLERRKRLKVTAGDEEIALFLIDGEVYALHDICIHKQRNLSKGLVFKGKVICPGHQWAFEPATGWNDEEDRCQPTYAVKVEEGVIYVDPERRVRASPPEPNERHAARR